MENFGSEIGQKMRSAVKAKLLELGTGSSTGYIDDELPDYVMIMVANKRSKQQMITDLDLFLGTQTELFVTWLHEVLQKLQEVTVPAASATSKKRKASQRDEAVASSSSNTKKDKKTSKREKKASGSKKASEDHNRAAGGPETPTTTTGPPVAVPVINSITDVFAEDLLEKAKKTLVVTASASANIKKGKGKKAAVEEEQPQASAVAAKEGSGDAPNVSEISSTTGATVSGSREKDLEELAEIQKKIYAAKKQLKHLEQINEAESEDEDFLNLKDDGSAEEFDEAGDLVKKKTSKPKSPITFEEKELVRQESAGGEKQREEDNALPSKRRLTTPPSISSAAIPMASSDSNKRDTSPTSTSKQRNDTTSRRSRERERRDPPSQAEKKRSVHERLGQKAPERKEPPAPERRERQDKELYVPTHRRRDLDGERNREQGKGRSGEREHDREKDRKRGRERNSARRRPSLHEQPTSSSTTANGRSNSSSNARKKPDSSGGRGSASPRTLRQRIGSHVIVATTKSPEPSDDEADKPVNSVIQVKPRIQISPSKQACKNLLLRAVAEAQRSTVLTKAKASESLGKVTVRLDETGSASERSTKLFSKSYRDRMKRSKQLVSSNPFRRTTEKRSSLNLLIEVESGLKSTEIRKRRRRNNILETQLEMEEYVPEPLSEQGGSDFDYLYVPQIISNTSEDEQRCALDYHLNEADCRSTSTADDFDTDKTQFVVTLNDDATLSKTCMNSPPPQVTSSSVDRKRSAETSSSSARTRNSGKKHFVSTRESRRSDIKSRLQPKTSSLSPSTATRFVEGDSANLTGSSNTPPHQRRSDFTDVYRNSKDLKKIIINNVSEADEHPSKKLQVEKHQSHKRRSTHVEEKHEEPSTTPPLPSHFKRRRVDEKAGAEKAPKKSKSSSPPEPLCSPAKQKRTPVNFDLNAESREQIDKDEERHRSNAPSSKRRSKSYEREPSPPDRRSGGEDYHHTRQKISIRNAEAKKYENIPSLSSVTIDSAGARINKPKERCKYHPNCTKHNCDFYHPSAPCKGFPNCKYGEKCIYSHPKCKFDMLCTNMDCTYSHSGPRNTSQMQLTAPPLSSHVVPVQNYKSISAAPAASSAMCKYYPNCTKVGCTFYHPKPCRFGKNCINKLECNFYHHELQSSTKFKWVATAV